MKPAKTIALCGVMAALSVVIMLLGAVLGLGLYASPMLAGICLIPVGRRYGKRYHVLLWIAVSVLSLILVPDVEEDLMFLCIFGCYPIVRPYFQRLAKGLRLVVKLLLFHVVFTALELLVMLVLVPEAIESVLMLVLILLGDITFLCYDFVLPYTERLLDKYIGKLMN